MAATGMIPVLVIGAGGLAMMALMVVISRHQAKAPRRTRPADGNAAAGDAGIAWWGGDAGGGDCGDGGGCD